MERHALSSVQLYLLFTPRLCKGEPWSTLREALSGGVQLVQWRVKKPDEEGLRRCLEICEANGVPVIINDEVELAVNSSAAGAHVGQEDMPVAEARAILGKERLLGVSTHDPQQVTNAITGGADHLGFGPIYSTDTKDYEEGQGAEALTDVLTKTDVPVFAIGGIHSKNLPSLLEVGCRRIAVSSAILRANDPKLEARTLRRLLD